MDVKPIDLSKTIRKIRSRLPVLLLVLFASTAVSAGVAMNLPKKYKARFSISIYGRYFKNPLVSEFTPDIAESGELKAQREVLIRQALSQEFLDALGEKEGFFRHPPHHPKRVLERQDLLERLEVASLNQTTYQVSFVSGSPEQALKVLQASLSQIRTTLVRERVRSVELLRDALKSQIESLGLSLGKGSAPVPALQADTLRSELASIRAQIQTNLSVFSESHPVVQRLQGRAKSIEESIARSAAGSDDSGAQARAILLDSAPLTNQDPSRAREDLYQDLFKKFNYLGIVARLEQKSPVTYFGVVEEPMLPVRPFFPNKAYFLAWGLMFGVLVCCVLVFTAPEESDSAEDDTEYDALSAIKKINAKTTISYDNAKTVKKTVEAGLRPGSMNVPN